MPIPANELSAFFDNLYMELRKEWERRVDRAQMSELTKDRRLARLDDIGAILRALAEGQAVLTYQQPEQREPSPMIWLPWANNDA